MKPKKLKHTGLYWISNIYILKTYYTFVHLNCLCIQCLCCIPKTSFFISRTLPESFSCYILIIPFKIPKQKAKEGGKTLHGTTRIQSCCDEKVSG